jgi:hypothetical protein
VCVHYTQHTLEYTKAPPTSSGRGVRVVGADSKPVPTRFILPAYPKQKKKNSTKIIINSSGGVKVVKDSLSRHLANFSSSIC